MRLFTLSILFLAALFTFKSAPGQSNATLNILTLNSGQVAQGGVVDIQVTVGNTGPTAPIGVNKVRAQISIPSIATAAPNVDQTGLPAGWTITVNNGNTITVCNGTDQIPVGVQRQVFIKVQGVTLGGPSTVNGNLLFSSGASCTVPGVLNGDNSADNTATSSITVISPPACGLTVTAAAGTIACNGGTTTLTATPAGAAGAVEYSIDGTNFQSSNTFTTGAGTYTVTAREVTTPSCTNTAAPVIITEPTAVSASASVTTPVPVPGGEGTITVTASGGTGAITYAITSGPVINTTGATSGVFTNLTAGAYTFTATDANGCTGTANASLTNPTPGPANPSLNILTLNSGEVTEGEIVDIQVTVGNTGPSFIGTNKVRAQVSIPSIATAAANVDQTGLPAGWTITVNNGSSITVCNGTDPIPSGTQRQVFIKVRGVSAGGPSTINASLLFSNGTSCTIPGTQNGDNTADNIATTSLTVLPGTLPVTLTDFDATLVNCKPVLRWITESEINSDHFEIERRNAGEEWKVIGTVRANNQSFSKIEYKFTDATATADKVQYRLKMIDIDGSHEYSKTLLVYTECNKAQIHVFPNPAGEGKLYVSLTGTSGKAEVSLVSLTGQVMLRTRMGNGTNTLNVSKVAAGVYILNIIDANGIDRKEKVIIQN